MAENTKRLDANADVHLYDDIFADIYPVALTTTVELGVSEGPLKRGTVITAKSADGQFAPVSAALSEGDVVYILAENVDKAEAGDPVDAYKTGNFARGRLSTDGEYELVAADYEYMRDAGLQTKAIFEAPVLESV